MKKLIIMIGILLMSVPTLMAQNYGKDHEKSTQVMMVSVNHYTKSKKTYEACMTQAETAKEKSICSELVTVIREKRVLVKNQLIPCDSVKGKKYKKMCDAYKEN